MEAAAAAFSTPLSFPSVIHASNWIPWPAEQHPAAAADCKPLIREMRVRQEGQGAANVVQVGRRKWIVTG